MSPSMTVSTAFGHDADDLASSADCSTMVNLGPGVFCSSLDGGLGDLVWEVHGSRIHRIGIQRTL
jgi:hypothetical protein